MASLTYYSSTLPSLFPIVEDRCHLVDDSPSPSAGGPEGYAISNRQIALAHGATLLFGSWEGDSGLEEVSVEAAVDFDSPVTSVAWDSEGICTAVCDESGTLHLVKPDGSILLSKQVLAGQTLKHLQFIASDDLQSLYAVTASGAVLCLHGLALSKLCQAGASPADLGAVLKSIRFAKWSLPGQQVQKAAVLAGVSADGEGDAADRVIALADDGTLHIHTLDSAGSTTAVALLDLSQHTITDMHLRGQTVIATTGMGAVLWIPIDGDDLKVFYTGCYPHALHIDLVDDIGSAYVLAVSGGGRLYSMTCIAQQVIPHGWSDSTSTIQCYATSGRRGMTVSAVSGSNKLTALSVVSRAVTADIVKGLSMPITSKMAFGALIGVILQHLSSPELAVCASLFQQVLSLRFAPEVLLAIALLLPFLPQGDALSKVLVHLQGVNEQGLMDCQGLIRRWQAMLCVADQLQVQVEALLPPALPATLTALCSACKLSEAVVLLDQLVAFSLPKPSLSLEQVPLHCRDVHGILRLASSMLALGADVQALCENMLHRAVALSSVEGLEDLAAQLVQKALRCLQPIPDCQTLREELSKLSRDLSLQKALQDVLGIYVPRGEVSEFGWAGLINEQMDGALPDALEGLFKDLRRLTEPFNEVDLDAICIQWVKDTIARALDQELEDKDNTLSKLITVTSICKTGAVECVLQIFTLCALSSAEALGPIADSLCALTSRLAEQSDGEELKEAMRLFRIRLLAHSHGIQQVDLRDATQLLHAVNIIGNETLTDAMAFAMEGGVMRTDLQGLLVRKILAFITGTHWDDMEYDKAFNQLISCIPSSLLRNAREDACLSAMNQHTALVGHKTEHLVANRLVKGIIKLSELSDKKGSSSRASAEMAACLPAYRRLLQLHTQYEIYLSIHQVRKHEDCKKVVEGVCLAAVEGWLPKLPATQPHDAAPFQADLQLFSEQIIKLQKISRLMEVSPQVFVKVTTKKLVDAGRKQLAVAFARSQLEEIICSNDSDEDWEAVLDTIKIISMTAMTPNRNTGYYSTATSGDELDNTTILAAHKLVQSTLRQAVADCPPALLNRAIDLLDVHDLVLTTYDRIEGHSVQKESVLNIDSVFNHDGLLLQEDVIMPPLLQHCMAETKRRDGKAPTSSADVESLASILQRQGNHMLALRVLYRSWSTAPSKADLLKLSLSALSRHVLTYREVDESFAIACLSALDLDSIVKELRAAVPINLHSDFSRLQTVSGIGEQLASLFDGHPKQQEYTQLFEGLQTSAKWCHKLSDMHIPVDLKGFIVQDESAPCKYQRSLVPAILKATGDLEVTTAFCRDFEIEPEVAALQFIEHTLGLAPSSDTWATKVKAAALGLREDDLVQALIRALPTVHEVDYEKICFVCTWLLQLDSAPEEEEDDDDTGHTATLQGGAKHRTSTGSIYQRYIDLTKFLASVRLPRDVHAHLLHALPSLRAVYGSLEDSYQARLPFWMLCKNSWDLLGAALSASSTWAADKLLPAAIILGLSKEDFHARAALAAYRRCRSLDSVETSVKDHLLSRDKQVQLYLWIYEEELAQGPVQAIAALTKAITLLDAEPRLSYDLADLRKQLLKLKLERTLSSFLICLYPGKPIDVWKTFGQAGQSPQAVTERALELVIEAAWEAQLADQCGKAVTIYHIATAPIGRTMRRLLDSVTPLIGELYQHWAEADGATAPSSSALLGNMIAHCLMDSHSPTGSTAAGTLAEMVNPNLPSRAEGRRREDVFLGFAIALLVRLMPDQAQAAAAVTQLDQVMRATARTSGQSNRKASARSRLRAAQALVYWHGFTGAVDEVLLAYWRYFFCWAECTEIRLVTSEDALSAALGLTIGPGTMTITPSGSASACRSLLLTWLRDEAESEDALELGRDVYLLSLPSAGSQPVDSALLLKIAQALLGRGRGQDRPRALLVMLQQLWATGRLQEVIFSGGDALVAIGEALLAMLSASHESFRQAMVIQGDASAVGDAGIFIRVNKTEPSSTAGAAEGSTAARPSSSLSWQVKRIHLATAGPLAAFGTVDMREIASSASTAAQLLSACCTSSGVTAACMSAWCQTVLTSFSACSTSSEGLQWFEAIWPGAFTSALLHPSNAVACRSFLSDLVRLTASSSSQALLPLWMDKLASSSGVQGIKESITIVQAMAEGAAALKDGEQSTLVQALLAHIVNTAAQEAGRLLSTACCLLLLEESCRTVVKGELAQLPAADQKAAYVLIARHAQSLQPYLQGEDGNAVDLAGLFRS